MRILPSHIKTLAQNTSWVIFSKLIVFILSFGLMAALANLVSKETVGTYSYIISVLTIISITTLPGMNMALVRSVAAGREGGISTIATKRIMYGLIGSCISLCIGIWYMITGNPTLGHCFIIAAFFLPLTDTLNEIAVYYWVAKKAYRKSSTITIVYQILFTIPSILVLFLTQRIEYIIASFLCFQMIAGLLIYRSVKPRNDIRDTQDTTFGMHLTLMSAFRTIAIHSDRLLVWYMFGPVSVALYTFASTPITKLEQLIPIEQISLPALSGSTYSLVHKKLLLKRTSMLFIVILMMLGIGYYLSPFLYHLLFPQYPDAIRLFQLLLASVAFTPFLLLKTSFTAWHKKTQLYILDVSFPFIKIALVLIFGTLYGMTGVVSGVIIARAIEACITVILFQRLS